MSLTKSLHTAASAHNFTVRQLLALTILANGPQEYGNLSLLCGCSKPVLSRALDRLGSYGLTKRLRSRRDPCRTLTLSVTDKGAALVKKIAGEG